MNGGLDHALDVMGNDAERAAAAIEALGERYEDDEGLEQASSGAFVPIQRTSPPSG